MRPATGPLQTGTYISDLVDAPGKYTTVKGDRSKLALTDDSRTEDAAKWFIETLGNDVYRVSVTNFNVTLTPDLGQKTVDIGKGSSEWIIKETGVPGVYRFVVSLLALTLTETWTVADPPVAQTGTRTLKEVTLM
ncbi:hypothetical protein F5887DRAFT_1074536 [Amanita rubescens]|nr:hypothetical protein F5887DRAFT_1074536 [Amanita rubescens]